MSSTVICFMCLLWLSLAWHGKHTLKYEVMRPFYHATFMLWQHLKLWHYLDAEQAWLCCDQLGYKFLHFSCFSPSLCYVKLKKALNMEALLKTWLHRLDVPDIPRLQIQWSTQYHPDCWNLAELVSFWCYNLGYHLHWPPSMRWHVAVNIGQW